MTRIRRILECAACHAKVLSDHPIDHKVEQGRISIFVNYCAHYPDAVIIQTSQGDNYVYWPLGSMENRRK